MSPTTPTSTWSARWPPRSRATSPPIAVNVGSDSTNSGADSDAANESSGCCDEKGGGTSMSLPGLLSCGNVRAGKAFVLLASTLIVLMCGPIGPGRAAAQGQQYAG